MPRLNPELLVSFLLRIGLMIIFGYAGIDAFREPDAWLGYVPSFMSVLGPLLKVLVLLSIAQIVLALALLWRPLVAYVALLMALMLFGITFTNPGGFLIVFRDLGLAFAAVALVANDWHVRLFHK